MPSSKFDRPSAHPYSACKYMRELIRADEKRKAEEHLEAKLSILPLLCAGRDWWSWLEFSHRQ